jgi:hypothetical protein
MVGGAAQKCLQSSQTATTGADRTESRWAL